ncbi:DNA translocase FtsK 4TM domain-containing protein [Candidatus Saccharibacteria bacterium]|nr:DNA translocase FtsK 4TM domain-containing protein [Candidatus Saccharibacteria bacterium]
MPASRKKKSTKRSTRSSKSKRSTREPQVEHELPGGFWRQIVAVLMIAAALFLCFTWFGHGGNVLNTIHDTIMQGIGFATYFLPALLVYLAVKIFRSENNRVAIPVYLAGIIMLLWISGVAAISGNGGIIGNWLNGLMTKLLDQNVVIFVYIVLIFITLAFTLQISPLTLFKDTTNLVKTGKKKPTPAPAKEDKKLGQLEIKVNSGLATAPVDTAPVPIKSRFGLHKPLKAPRINQPKSTPEPAPEPEPEKEKPALTINDADWKMPSTTLLSKIQSPQDAGNVKQNAFIIQKTFAEFGIEVEMEDANIGPRVTQYTLRAPGGVNLAKIAARDKELAYNLSATTVRIEAPIPGTQLIGVEVPNVKPASVSLRGIVESPEWKSAKGALTFAVGKDISGKPVVADLSDMRHLLIAGTTGSGKSVMTNTLIMSLLLRNSPSDMRMIIVDPKHVEMVAYNDIPHLLTPVINDTSKALSAMKWAVGEMDRRYSRMADEKVKKITDYNAKMAEKRKDPAAADDPANAKMPYIVIVIDEMSDLMMQAGKELEPLIVRIAQLGRASGIHLVLATQKPIVKVITGLIKGNIPSRIAFRVLSSMESRIILDVSGAEKLLGQGDMLLSTEQTSTGPERVQGAWTPDDDIDKVTNFLRAQCPPQYNDEVIAQQVAIKGMPSSGGSDGFEISFDPQDPVVRRAVEVSLSKGKFSTANLQVYLSKGHAYVNRLAIWFEQIGVIGPANGNKSRDLLITSMEEFDQLSNQEQN